MADPMFHGPSHWSEITLEPSVSSKFITRVDSGGTPSTTNDDYWDGEIPWLTPKELSGSSNAMFVSSTERSITSSGLAGSSAKLLPPDTVMLTKRAPVGLVAINAVPMATNQGFLNFQCGELLRPVYLAHWLRANGEYLDMVANGSTYPELYKGDLFEFVMFVPPIEEQDRIINVLSALQFIALLGIPLEQSSRSPSMVVSIHEQDARIERIYNSLVPALLSGSIPAASLSNYFPEV